jgi:hypothetical protein
LSVFGNIATASGDGGDDVMAAASLGATAFVYYEQMNTSGHIPSKVDEACVFLGLAAPYEGAAPVFKPTPTNTWTLLGVRFKGALVAGPGGRKKARVLKFLKQTASGIETDPSKLQFVVKPYDPKRVLLVQLSEELWGRDFLDACVDLLAKMPLLKHLHEVRSPTRAERRLGPSLPSVVRCSRWPRALCVPAWLAAQHGVVATNQSKFDMAKETAKTWKVVLLDMWPKQQQRNLVRALVHTLVENVVQVSMGKFKNLVATDATLRDEQAVLTKSLLAYAALLKDLLSYCVARQEAASHMLLEGFVVALTDAQTAHPLKVRTKSSRLQDGSASAAAASAAGGEATSPGGRTRKGVRGYRSPGLVAGRGAAKRSKGAPAAKGAAAASAPAGAAPKRAPSKRGGGALEAAMAAASKHGDVLPPPAVGFGLVPDAEAAKLRQQLADADAERDRLRVRCEELQREKETLNSQVQQANGRIVELTTTQAQLTDQLQQSVPAETAASHVEAYHIALTEAQARSEQLQTLCDNLFAIVASHHPAGASLPPTSSSPAQLGRPPPAQLSRSAPAPLGRGLHGAGGSRSSSPLVASGGGRLPAAAAVGAGATAPPPARGARAPVRSAASAVEITGASLAQLRMQRP